MTPDNGYVYFSAQHLDAIEAKALGTYPSNKGQRIVYPSDVVVLVREIRELRAENERLKKDGSLTEATS